MSTFEHLPYTNFHDLNMDWIISVVKDFFEKYNHIQETIDHGIEDLEATKTRLENLLEAWYETHSEDIANQLADALSDLNDWYNSHQNLFNDFIQEKARDAIASIPSDYSALYNQVQSISDKDSPIMMQFCNQSEYAWKTGYWELVDGVLTLNISQPQYKTIVINNLKPGRYFINNYSAHQSFIKNIVTGEARSFYDSGYQTSNTNTIVTLASPSDIYLVINTQNVSIHNTVFSNVWAYKNILNPYSWNSGYWNNDGTFTEDSHYKRTVVRNCKPGNYEFNYYSPWQTYIKRLSDNTVISMGALGYATANNKITINISYDFDIYLTQRDEAIPYYENTLFYHKTIESDKLEYGVYKKSGNIFHVGTTHKIKLLSEGIEIAKSIPDSILIVDPGTYNMYEELGGDAYFNSYRADSNVPTDYYEPNWGIFLSNGIHIICSQGVDIYFLYEGNNSDVQSKFSLFNGGTRGFTIENALIRTKNIRYSIHDDMGSFILPYKTEYKNCKITHDSSSTSWGAHQAIGGGFGRHGLVIIDSCYLDSTYWIPVSYHNSAGLNNAELTSGVFSKLYMNDSWLSGVIVTNAYGASRDMTEVYVCGCSVGADLPDPQITGDYGVMNVVSNRWNNTVRN